MASALARRPFTQLASLSRSIRPSSVCMMGDRGFAEARSDDGLWRSSAAGDQEPPSGPPAVDITYRSPTDMVWPAAKHQERFASRLFTSLTSVLLHNTSLGDRLVQELGFAVKDIRMSPDNLKAYIQWDSFTGQHVVLEHELQRQLPKLKTAVAHALRARNMPQLVFKHDTLTHRQQEIEDAFRQLEEAEAAEQEEGGEEDNAGEESDGDPQEVQLPGKRQRRPTSDQR